jgi:hypothetical protein
MVNMRKLWRFGGVTGRRREIIGEGSEWEIEGMAEDCGVGMKLLGVQDEVDCSSLAVCVKLSAN